MQANPMRRFAILFVVILLGSFAFELTPPGQAIVVPWTGLVATSSAVARISGLKHTTASGVEVQGSGFGPFRCVLVPGFFVEHRKRRSDFLFKAVSTDIVVLSI